MLLFVRHNLKLNLNQTREITDKFTVEVEMDRRCYEELLDERKNMELTYEERIAQLQDQHTEVRPSSSFSRVYNNSWHGAATDAITFNQLAHCQHGRPTDVIGFGHGMFFVPPQALSTASTRASHQLENANFPRTWANLDTLVRILCHRTRNCPCQL